MQCFNPIADCPKHYRVRVCTCTCTRVRARAHRRRRPQGKELVLSFPLTTGSAPWLDGSGRHCALCFVRPCFSFKSLQGNAIIRNTKGRKCRRSTTHPRGSVKDKTSKWSREKGEPRESKRKSRRVPETRLCALTDLVPWDWSKSQGCSLAPLKTA